VKHSHRRRLIAVASSVLMLNVIAWGAYTVLAARMPAASLFIGAGVLAYVLGVRHAFDADHIAAIDDTTRLMIGQGRRPVALGFFFALGHSSLVVILVVIMVLVVQSPSSGSVWSIQPLATTVSLVAASAFLLLVGALNAIALVRVVRQIHLSRSQVLDGAAVDRALAGRGVFTRLLGKQSRRIDRSWHMFPLGALFGLGMETASEVALLGLSLTAATAGTLPAMAVLTLPLLFAAGMTTFDTLDGILMTHLYEASSFEPSRRLAFNAVMTLMTIIVSFGVGSIYLASLLSGIVDLGVIDVIGSLDEHINIVGITIVSLYALAWAGTFVAWRVVDRRTVRA
jgi:nickel/cobalt transporter (NiCoT) family protein